MFSINAGKQNMSIFRSRQYTAIGYKEIQNILVCKHSCVCRAVIQVDPTS